MLGLVRSMKDNCMPFNRIPTAILSEGIIYLGNLRIWMNEIHYETNKDTKQIVLIPSRPGAPLKAHRFFIWSGFATIWHYIDRIAEVAR